MKKLIIILFIARSMSAVAGQSNVIIADALKLPGTSSQYVQGNGNVSSMPVQSQSDFTQTSSSAVDYIKNKPGVYDKSGNIRNVPLKIMTDTFTVNAGNDYTVNISAMAYTQIFGVFASPVKSVSNGYQCPQVHVNSYTLTSVLLDFAQGNNALPVLAVLFPGTIFVTDYTGLKVSLTVFGY